MNILIALLPSLCWGNIGLVSGICGGNSKEQILGMSIGSFFLSVILTLIFKDNFAANCTLELWITGFAMGAFWCTGQYLQLVALKCVGISKGFSISTGGQLALNAISGALLFGEWKTGFQITFGFLAVLILILGAAATAFKEKNKNEADDAVTTSDNWKSGMPALIISTVCFALYTGINTWRGLDSKSILLPQSAGIIFAGFLIGLRKSTLTKKALKNIFNGNLFILGNFFLLISIQKIGLAIAFSFSQVGVVFSTFGSIFLLGEKKTKKEMIFVILGSVMIILGAVILGIIK